jgi:hypothetical protein
MTDEANHEGAELVTGIIGESFWVDKDGHRIPDPTSEQPTELPSAADIWDAGDKGILPDRSQEIGGPDDETQKEIWAAMERGEFGSGAGTTPEDAETVL